MKPTALTMTLPLAASHAAFADLPRPTFYCTFDRRSDAGFGVGDASSATMAPDATLVAEADRLRKGGVDRIVVKGKVSKARRFDAGALFPAEGNFSPLRGTVIRRQNHRPAETAARKTFVQVAIAYQGNRTTIFRNGAKHAAYEVRAAERFGRGTFVLGGLRHADAAPRNRFLTGSIEDA